jgi:predicted phage terminase large subunit-like protein
MSSDANSPLVNLDPHSILPLARADLACYALAMCPDFRVAKHHRVLIDTLEQVERGAIKRLMVFMPPRHGKSLTASCIFPAWFLGRNPRRSVIAASYGAELAEDFGRRVRNFMSDPLHAAIFPECKLSADSAAQRRFDTTAGGSYYAVGRGGAVTGRGADLLLLDDLLKDSEEARSETIRRSMHDWFQHVAYTRLAPGGALVLIQTRWHDDDLPGRLLREHADENWQVICMPAIAEVDDEFRQVGEALWPEKFPVEMLKMIRNAIGGSAWDSLYRLQPSAAEGAVFKREWWRFFSEQPACKRIVQSWDTAFKSGAENDFSVCTTWGVTQSGYYLLWVWRDRVEFPELKRRMSWLANQWKPSQILIEDRASGQSLIQELRHSTRLPIIPIKVDTDKLARAQSVTPLIEAGRVFLPESAPWLNDFIDELAAFPKGTHDDCVDSVTQALNYLRHEPQDTVAWWPVRL